MPIIFLMEEFTSFLPKLDFSKYKGCGGKVGIIGGCFEYTGAPFFAAQAVLRCGGDLSHVFCSPSAATPIKAYAPETIVHPYLPDDNEFDKIDSSIDRITKCLSMVNSLVIGPGLGRNPCTLEFAEKFIERLKINVPKMPVILDADALFLVSQKPNIVKGCKNFIMTPNGGEYIRLCDSLSLPRDAPVIEIAKKLDGPNIFAKGKIDRFTDGEHTWDFDFPGSARRVGGQGDLTSGAWGLFASYAPNNYPAAAAAVSEIIKKAALLAFEKKGRSTITTDIMDEIPNAIPLSWNKVYD